MNSSYPPDSPEPIFVAEIADSPTQLAGDSLQQPPIAKTKQPSCLMPCLIATSIMLLLLIGIGVGLWQLLKPPATIKQTAAQAKANQDELYTNVRTVFSADTTASIDQNELDAIKRFAQSVAQTVDGTVNSQLENVIDYQRYAQQMQQHSELGGQTFLGKTILSMGARQRIIGPIPFSSFQIFKIETLSKNERLVYLQTSGEYEMAEPSLWWIIRDKNRWKLYDWQVLEYVVTDAHETAALIGETVDAKALAYDRYSELCVESLTYYDALYEPDVRKKLESVLREIETLKVVDIIQPTLQLDLAARWLYADKPHEAIRVADTIANPQSVPGVYRVKARAYRELNEHAAALENFELYRQRVGDDWETLVAMADAHQELEQFEQEYQMRSAAVRFDSDDYRYFSNIGRLLSLDGPEKFPTMLEQAKSRTFAKEIYQTLLYWSANEPLTIDYLRTLTAHLQQHQPESPITLDANSKLKLATGNIDDGLADMYQSIVNEEDPYWPDFWSMAQTHGKLPTAYRIAAENDGAQAAIDGVHQTYQSYDYDFEIADVLQVLTLHAEKFPNDPLIDYYHGLNAYEAKDYTTAIKRLSTVSSRLTDSDNENLTDEVNSMLAQAYYLTSEPIKAVRVATKSYILDGLCDSAAKKNDLAAFQLFLDAEGWEPEQQRLQNARLLALKNQFTEFVDLLAGELQTLQRPENAYLQNRIVQQLVETSHRKGKILTAFAAAPIEPVFKQCLERLIEDRDWESAEKLLSDWDQSKSGDVDIIGAKTSGEIELLFAKQDYATLIERYAPESGAVMRFTSSDVEGDLEKLTRAALRHGSIDLARTIAQRLQQDFGSLPMLRLVLLHERKLDEFSLITRGGFDVWESAAHDPDFPALTAAEMATITSTKPRSIYGYEFGRINRVNVLLSNEIEISSATLKQAAKELFQASKRDSETDPSKKEKLAAEPISVNEIAHQPAGVKAFVIRSGTVQVVLQVITADQQTAADTESVTLAKQLKEHRAHISITVVDRLADYDRDELKVAIKFAKAISETLAADQILLLDFDDHWLDWETAQPLIEQWTAGTLPYSKLTDSAETISGYGYGSVLDDVETEIDFQRITDFNKSLASVCADLIRRRTDTIAADSDPESERELEPLIVQARFAKLGATEVWPVNIREIEISFFGNAEFIGELQTDSQLDATFPAGSLVILNWSDLVGWQRGDKSGSLDDTESAATR